MSMRSVPNNSLLSVRKCLISKSWENKFPIDHSDSFKNLWFKGT